MKTSYHKRYTVSNNLNATNNVLAAIVESGQDIHLAHLGTIARSGSREFSKQLRELNKDGTQDASTLIGSTSNGGAR